MAVQGLMREARAGVFAALCLSLSAALHTAVAGMAPSATALLAGCALTWGAAFAAARKERGYLAIAVLMLLGQAGLHLLFHALPAEHMLHGMPPAAGGPLMVWAHVAAGLVAAAWLRGGEAALGRLREQFRFSLRALRLLLAMLRRPVPVRLAARIVVTHEPTAPSTIWRREGVVRRGPPLFA